jgi:hypothetical protein
MAYHSVVTNVVEIKKKQQLQIPTGSTIIFLKQD